MENRDTVLTTFHIHMASYNSNLRTENLRKVHLKGDIKTIVYSLLVKETKPFDLKYLS